MEQQSSQQVPNQELQGTYPNYSVPPANIVLNKPKSPNNISQPLIIFITAIAFTIIGVIGYKFYQDNDLGEMFSEMSSSNSTQNENIFGAEASAFEYTDANYPNLVIPYNDTWEITASEDELDVPADLELHFEQNNILQTTIMFNKNDTQLKFILAPTTFIEGSPVCYEEEDYPVIKEINEDLLRISYDSGGVIDDFVYSYNFKLKNSEYTGNAYQFMNYFDSYELFSLANLNTVDYTICGYGGNKLRTEEVTQTSYPSLELNDRTLIATIDIELEGEDEEIHKEADYIVSHTSF